jgi:hypothetical protein
MKTMTFNYKYIPKMEDVREHIQQCEGRHTQQAMYSTFHDALTQICFGCRAIRSTINRQPSVQHDPFLAEHDPFEKEAA